MQHRAMAHARGCVCDCVSALLDVVEGGRCGVVERLVKDARTAVVRAEKKIHQRVAGRENRENIGEAKGKVSQPKTSSRSLS